MNGPEPGSRTGRYSVSGNGKSRNALRPMPVYVVLDWDALEDRAHP